MIFPEFSDDRWFDDKVLQRECLSFLDIYEDEIQDYQAFFRGKTVMMLGLSKEEKVWMRNFILLNGGKAYLIRTDNPDIILFGSDFWYYDMLHIYEHQQNGDKVIVVSYENIKKGLDQSWYARVDAFDKEQADKEKERKEKYKNSLCDKAYLEKLNWVGPDSLSLYNDVFFVCGRLAEYWENTKEQLIEDIEEKLGHVNKKKKKTVTCVIMGEKVTYGSLEDFNSDVKFVKYYIFKDWLHNQKTAYPDLTEFKEKYASSKDSRLRPYQQEVKDRLFSLWEREKNVMLQMPTGAGKTILFSSVINDIVKASGSKILIIAHRTELIEQIDAHLSKYNIEHGIIASNKARNMDCDVQVASIQTLTHKSNEKITRAFVPSFIIVDEAHHTLANTYTRLWDLYPLAWKLGVTATPCRLNCSSFRTHFEDMIESLSVKELVKEGYLSDYVYYTENPDSDLSKAIQGIKGKSSTGDYRVSDLLQSLNVEEHISKLIVCYTKYANGLKGIVYGISIEHAHNICEAYRTIGVTAEFIDSKTPRREREQIIEDFKQGNTKVLVNVDIFSEGFDCPDIEFVQMARPTWSLSKYMQQVGRGLRTSPGKNKTIILDNAGMYARFGLPTDNRDWKSMFEGADVRDSYVRNIYRVNRYLRENFGAASDLMLLVNRDVKTPESNDEDDMSNAQEEKKQKAAEGFESVTSPSPHVIENTWSQPVVDVLDSVSPNKVAFEAEVSDMVEKSQDCQPSDTNTNCDSYSDYEEYDTDTYGEFSDGIIFPKDDDETENTSSSSSFFAKQEKAQEPQTGEALCFASDADNDADFHSEETDLMDIAKDLLNSDAKGSNENLDCTGQDVNHNQAISPVGKNLLVEEKTETCANDKSLSNETEEVCKADILYANYLASKGKSDNDTLEKYEEIEKEKITNTSTQNDETKIPVYFYVLAAMIFIVLFYCFGGLFLLVLVFLGIYALVK